MLPPLEGALKDEGVDSSGVATTTMSGSAIVHSSCRNIYARQKQRIQLSVPLSDFDSASRRE